MVGLTLRWRRWLLALALGVLMAPPAPAALAHASFLGSSPAPGERVKASPGSIALRFTESLNRTLSAAFLVDARTGRRIPTRLSASGTAELSLQPLAALGRDPYRVDWHTVSTDDGHALQGSFAFGVRAAAVGGTRSVQQSPFADGGWLRALVRMLFYVALFLFAGMAFLRALLPARGRGSWLVPGGVADQLPAGTARALEERATALVLDAGLAATAGAAALALLDTANAAGGISVSAVHDYLLANGAGLARVSVVGILLLAVAAGRALPRLGAIAVVLALGGLSLSGHASAADPRAAAVAADWIHLIAASAWIGGLGAIAYVWGREIRRLPGRARLAVMRLVLKGFGQVALPAFAVVVVSGAISALLELGRAAALWETGYGRVLLLKMTLVAAIATVSYLHAMRLRPRLLAANPHPDPRLEARHWRLLRREPWLAVGALAAVAVLVAFPLPPRQLADLARASAALPAVACSPCPLPTAGSDQLAVADQAGSDVVAAWIRRTSTVQAQVRVFDVHGNVVPRPFETDGAIKPPRSCGAGCEQVVLPIAASELRVRVGEGARTFVTTLPVRWLAGRSRPARRLLGRAQQVMRALRSVRDDEVANSVPGIYALTSTALRAPDRLQAVHSVLNYHVSARPSFEGRLVVIGATEWDAQPGLPWHKGIYGAGLPFRLPSWFTWTTHAEAAQLLGFQGRGVKRVAQIALYDPGTPAWWRLWIEMRTGRALRSRLITNGESSTERYYAFNSPVTITPPRSASP